MLPERPSGPCTEPSSDMTKLLRTQPRPSGAGWRYSSTRSESLRIRTAPSSGLKINCTVPSSHVISTRFGTAGGHLGHNRPMAKRSDGNLAPPLITKPLSEVLRLPVGHVDMSTFDPAAKAGFPGDKQDAPAMTDALAPALSDLQERLFAAGRVEESRTQRILVVLQGMDTSGKGGVIRHAI